MVSSRPIIVLNNVETVLNNSEIAKQFETILNNFEITNKLEIVLNSPEHFQLALKPRSQTKTKGDLSSYI